MKKIIRNAFVAIICILSWFTVSPIFYYLAGRWELTKWRLLLMLVSPLFLIAYLFIFIWGYDAYVNYQRKYYFADEDRIERITGVRLPDMKVIEYNEGRRITRDYNDRLIVEFEEVPSEIVFQILDSLVNMGKAGWRMNDSSYVFSATWGNDIPAPKGENNNEDRSFSISFSKGSKRATIHNGMW